jgi:uncharacterized phage protein (TIGR01671 family)
MSREIKFRAWDIIRKQLFNLNDNLSSIPYYELFCHTPDSRALILQQFTGLHDKNGKEIYESDLVRSIHFEDAEGKTHYLIHKIVWSDIYSGWIAVSQGDKEMPPFIKAGTIQLFTYMKFAQGVEIIGNIHENPELLEVKK